MDSSQGIGVVLSERLELNGCQVETTLFESGVFKWQGSSFSGSFYLPDDLLGAKNDGNCVTLTSFKFESKGCLPFCEEVRVRKDYVLKTESASDWYREIEKHLSKDRPKRLLIFLNPFGGKRLAKSVFHNQVQPLLSAAGIEFTLEETQYRFHAKELAAKVDLSSYNGIVCVSGDGVLLEVLNGLLSRDDWQTAIKMPLGVIPAGTGNGMAKSILHEGHEAYSVANATFAIIRGHKQSLDVTTLAQRQIQLHSVLMFTWGIVADVDIESEKLRSLGSLRSDIYSIIRIFKKRKYSGTIGFVPAPGYECTGELITANSELFFPSHEVSQTIGYRGPSVPDRTQWRVIRGEFVMVWLLNVPWPAENVQAGPSAKFADGCLDLVIIRDCPRLKLLSLFLKLSDGSHVKSKYVEYLKVKAFRLAPKGRVDSKIKGGYLDLDGEVLARGQGAYGDDSRDPMLYGPVIQMTVDQGLATIFSVKSHE